MTLALRKTHQHTQPSHCNLYIAPYMYIDGHATENYDASTLKVYASIRITQILGNLTHAQTDCTRPFFGTSPAKDGLGKRLGILMRSNFSTQAVCACPVLENKSREFSQNQGK